MIHMIWLATLNLKLVKTIFKTLMSDLKKIQKSKYLLMFADKTKNLYEMSPDQYLFNLITISLKHKEKPNSSPKPELIKKQPSSQNL